MRRVVVVGSSGAGKTTFARALAAVRDVPVVHLDQHYWRPGWKPTPAAEWRARQAELLDEPRWIADGTAHAQLDVRLALADTVIVLAPSRTRCLWNAAKRIVTNWHRDVQAPGCPERLSPRFFYLIWRFPRHARAELERALAAHAPHAEIIELRSIREIDAFLRRAAFEPTPA